MIKKTIQNFIHRFKKIAYLQIQEYEILKCIIIIIIIIIII